MNKITTILFDLDGTLLNTLADLHTSLNYALTQYHLPTKSLEEVRCSVGNGIERLIELSVPGGTAHPDFGGVLSCYAAHYQVHCNDQTQPYPGVLELLSQLRKRGCQLALISNKQDEAVQELKELYFTGLIDVAIGPKSGIRRKPAPDATLEVLRRLGSSKENSVYVGDSEVDILTARNAGIKCISVSWGFRTKEELRSAGAEFMIDQPLELLDFLEPTA